MFAALRALPRARVVKEMNHSCRPPLKVGRDRALQREAGVGAIRLRSPGNISYTRNQLAQSLVRAQ
jgi:hypothetical protein